MVFLCVACGVGVNGVVVFGMGNKSVVVFLCVACGVGVNVAFKKLLEITSEPPI